MIDENGAAPACSWADKMAKKPWLVIAMAFLVFWAVYLVYFAPRRRPMLENTGLLARAEYEWSLLDLNDQPVSFSRYKGKPVFLNIWATWCGPCVREMPSIARLARDPKMKGKNFEFVCVSIDQSTDVVRKFLRGKDWTMTFLRAEKVPEAFATDGIPATFVIADDGSIPATAMGAAEWDDKAVVADILRLVETARAQHAAQK